MTFADSYRSDKFDLSFELFPPKTDKGDEALLRHVETLMAYKPRMITCTYGAGGSTQNKTLQVISNVHKTFGVPVATHLTCVGSTKDDLRTYLKESQSNGVQNVVALRGDPPKDQSEFIPVEGGLRYANELVTLIRDEFPELSIAVAGYPEVHREAPSPDVDLENLKRKVDAGADAVLSQLFYDNNLFFDFLEHAQAIGIQVPIVPGLLPITNYAQIKRITSLCGAVMPKDLVNSLEACGDDSKAQFEVGVEFAAQQTQALIDAGVPGVHYYVLNQSAATSKVLENITLPS